MAEKRNRRRRQKAVCNAEASVARLRYGRACAFRRLGVLRACEAFCRQSTSPEIEHVQPAAIGVWRPHTLCEKVCWIAQPQLPVHSLTLSSQDSAALAEPGPKEGAMVL